MHAGFTFGALGSPTVGSFLRIFCDAEIHSPGVTMDITGPDGAPIDIALQQNDVLRGSIEFDPLSESDSGVYTCTLSVDGLTEDSITAVLDSRGNFI